MTTKRTPADVLREARKQDSRTKRAKVLAVVDDMKAKGEAITFLGVAKTAGVSNWLVYAEGVREHIEAARKGQKGTQRRERQSGTSVSAASLAVDLELTRAELKRVKEERDRLKAKVQRGLGQQIDQAGNNELENRIRALGDELRKRDTALAKVQAERDALQGNLNEAEDTVAALRQSLRQMMRDQSP